MIRQMTREQYRQEFGVEPTVPTISERMGAKGTVVGKINPIEEKEIKSPGRNFGQKAAGFLGIEKLGQGIGQAIFNQTNQKKELDTMLDRGQVSSEDYTSITTGGLRNRDVIGSAISTGALFAPIPSKGGLVG